MPASDFNWSSQQKQPIFQVFGNKRKADNAMESDETFMQNPEMKRRCIAPQNIEDTDQNRGHINKVHPQLQSVHNAHAQRAPSPRPLFQQTPPSFPNMGNNNHLFAQQQQMLTSQPTHLQMDQPLQNQAAAQSPLLQQQQCYGFESVIEFYDSGSGFGDSSSMGQTSEAGSHCLSSSSSQQEHVTQQRVAEEMERQRVHYENQQNHIIQTDEHIMDLNDEVYTPTSSAYQQMSAMDSDCAPDPYQYRANDCPHSDAMDKIVSNEPAPIEEHHHSAGAMKCLCRPNWDASMSLMPYVSDIY